MFADAGETAARSLFVVICGEEDEGVEEDDDEGFEGEEEDEEEVRDDKGKSL